jgi:hypothetical protein
MKKISLYINLKNLLLKLKVISTFTFMLFYTLNSIQQAQVNLK